MGNPSSSRGGGGSRGSAGSGGGGGGGGAATAKAAPAPTPAAAPVTGAVVRFDPDYSPAEQAELMIGASKLLGQAVTPRELATLSGAPAGTRVTIHDVSFGQAMGQRVALQIQSPELQSNRTLFKAPNGKLVIHNDYLFIDPAAQGGGIGARILGQQARTAARLGVSRLETDAARGPGMVGYKVWPKLGYDARIPAEVRAKLPKDLAKASKVSDLMRSERGRTFWDQNGVTTPMTFDLKAGSYSRRTLDAYLKYKGITP